MKAAYCLIIPSAAETADELVGLVELEWRPGVCERSGLGRRGTGLGMDQGVEETIWSMLAGMASLTSI